MIVSDMEVGVTNNIRTIFKKNIELLELIDKAVLYFREGQYDLALDTMAQTGDGINLVAEAIMKNTEYFGLASTDSVAQMLNDILEAKKRKDFVLLADLYELQLGSFICSVQELIMKREDYFGFDEEAYNTNIKLLDEKIAFSLTSVGGLASTDDERERLRVNQSAELHEMLDGAQLLDDGYFVEFTSCGLMTVGALSSEGERMYLHTNGRVSFEAFTLARKWFVEGIATYIIYGFGMGYHIAELAKLAPKAQIIVFESDMNILRLHCAFSGDTQLLHNNNIEIVYDPDFVFLDRRLSELSDREKLCVHYPSFRRVKNEAARELLFRFIPWSRVIEEC